MTTYTALVLATPGLLRHPPAKAVVGHLVEGSPAKYRGPGWETARFVGEDVLVDLPDGAPVPTGWVAV